MKKWIPMLAALAVATPLCAQTAAPPPARSSAMSDGVVRKIDAANGTVTLKHGPLVNLDMQGMTMVFRARPPELLKGIKIGDAVKFHAEYVGGVFIVTALQPAP